MTQEFNYKTGKEALDILLLSKYPKLSNFILYEVYLFALINKGQFRSRKTKLELDPNFNETGCIVSFFGRNTGNGLVIKGV